MIMNYNHCMMPSAFAISSFHTNAQLVRGYRCHFYVITDKVLQLQRNVMQYFKQ